jgi:hypothetical protein
MSDFNSLTEITTIPDFLNAVKEKYQLNLPTDFSGNSPISKLMQTKIKVELGKTEGILYEARGDPFNFENSSLKAKVIIAIVTSDYINQNCYKLCIWISSPFNSD